MMYTIYPDSGSKYTLYVIQLRTKASYTIGSGMTKLRDQQVAQSS